MNRFFGVRICLAFSLGLMQLANAQNADTCGTNAECSGPEVGQYVYNTGSHPTIPGRSFSNEQDALAYAAATALTNLHACTANIENPSWQPVPASPPSGSIAIGDPAAAQQATGDFWTLNFVLATEAQQFKWTTRVKGKLGTNTNPLCGTDYFLNTGVLRTRFVACPEGFFENNVTQPFGAYCYRPINQPQKRKNLGPCNDCSLNTPHPVNISNGNKFLLERDYTGTGAFPLTYTRAYNSLAWFFTQQPGAGPNYFVAVQNWRGTYDRSVLVSESLTHPTAFAYREDGRVLRYSKSGGQWVSDADVNERLTQTVDGSGNPTGWRLVTSTDEIETYDVDGHLLTLKNRAGITHTLTYDTSGKLVSATHSNGQQLQFSYDANSRPSMVTLPGGGTITFGYGPNSNLTSVTYPDTRVRTYQYNNPFVAHGVTDILDESNLLHASFSYASDGRVATSELAGGADHYAFSYTTNSSTTVTDAFGVARTFDFANIQGGLKGTAISQICPGCADAPKAKTFDTNGNVKS